VVEEGLYFQPADAQDGGDTRAEAAGRHLGDVLRDGGAVIVDYVEELGCLLEDV
jgi:hypothetical protein